MTPAAGLTLAALVLAPPARAAHSETVTITGTAVAFDLVRITGAKPGAATFWIGAREVTWAEYDLYAESARDEKVDGVTRPTQPDVENPRAPFRDGTVQTGRFPARSIGWYGACGYCAWLSHRTGRRFRLPTEAEWTAAAGSGTDPAPAWDEGNSGGHAHPAGSLPPNDRGIYDLLGNVWELCLEPFKADGTGVAVRGGGFNTPPGILTPELRQKMPVDAWLAGDPKRPLRAWWLTDAPFVGFRITSPGDDHAGPEARAAAIGRLTAHDVTVVDPGSDPMWVARITGVLAYGGGDPLDEVELEVCFTDPSGIPIRIDPRAKPAFGLAWPVLAATAHPDGREQPLKGGETRHFTVDVPVPFDEVGAIPHGAPSVKVTWVHFAR